MYLSVLEVAQVKGCCPRPWAPLLDHLPAIFAILRLAIVRWALLVAKQSRLRPAHCLLGGGDFLLQKHILVGTTTLHVALGLRVHGRTLAFGTAFGSRGPKSSATRSVNMLLDASLLDLSHTGRR